MNLAPHAGITAIGTRLGALLLALCPFAMAHAQKPPGLPANYPSKPVRVLIDHCGRPTVKEGLNQPGFRALLRLAATGRVHVKLSGYSKFSNLPYPFEDTRQFVRAIVEAFTLDRCLWASDWPFLRAPQRQDYVVQPLA